MKRIFDITKSSSENLYMQKIAYKLRSSSKFQIAYKKSKFKKNNKEHKSISADIRYIPEKRAAKIEIHESGKKGHKNRHYLLENVSESIFNKLHDYLNEEKWNLFFNIINSYRKK